MLLLVPSPLSQDTPRLPILSADIPLVQSCKTWVVENAKPARAALALLQTNTPVRELKIHEIGSLKPEQQKALIEEAKAGNTVGLMSDAGCPGIADPGSTFVIQAHQADCLVRPLVGPSSIILALMASGLNGQQFTFYGYPPIEPAHRETWIKQTEKHSKTTKSTEIIIETPFRNNKLLESLLRSLEPSTQLCLAWDITGNQENIQTKPVSEWRKRPPLLGKLPCLFLWLAQA